MSELVKLQGCPKCGGSVALDEFELPDKTYEVYCLHCGNRNFPDNVVIATNILKKLKRGKAKWSGFH